MSNVLLIVIDALRARNLPEYGYDKMTAPNISKLCDESFVYRNAYAPFNYTTPSVTSMLTGERYFNHGIWRLVISKELQDFLACPTIAQKLSSYYTTFCINEILIDMFDKEGIIWKDFHFAPSNYSGVKGKKVHPRGPLPVHPTSEQTTNIVLELLKNKTIHEGRPFFMYVHYWGTHYPWDKSALKYIDEFYDDSIPKISISKYLQGCRNPESRSLLWESIPEGIDDLNYLLAWCDAEIKETDYYIGKILSKIPEDTLVIITADHAEARGEHDVYFGHAEAGLFNEVLHVPLIVRYPFRRRKTIYKNIELRRIHDIILNWIENKKAPIFEDDHIYSCCRDSDAGIIDCLIKDGLKLFIRNFNKETYGYNLISDFNEQHPLPIENDKRFRSLQNILIDYANRIPPRLEE